MMSASVENRSFARRIFLLELGRLTISFEFVVYPHVLNRLRQLGERVAHRRCKSAVVDTQPIDFDPRPGLDTNWKTASLDELDQDFVGTRIVKFHHQGGFIGLRRACVSRSAYMG